MAARSHTAEEQLGPLAIALGRAARSDGLPCKISPGALHQRFGGPLAQDTGWLLIHRWHQCRTRCAAHGIRLFRYTPPPAPGRVGIIELRAPTTDDRQDTLL
jgi:hypothetical protein